MTPTQELYEALKELNTRLQFWFDTYREEEDIECITKAKQALSNYEKQLQNKGEQNE